MDDVRLEALDQATHREGGDGIRKRRLMMLPPPPLEPGQRPQLA
jgi:hypothetical protein